MGMRASSDLRRLDRNARERAQVLGLVAAALALASVACLGCWGTLNTGTTHGEAPVGVAHGPHSPCAPGEARCREQRQMASLPSSLHQGVNHEGY